MRLRMDVGISVRDGPLLSPGTTPSMALDQTARRTQHAAVADLAGLRIVLRPIRGAIQQPQARRARAAADAGRLRAKALRSRMSRSSWRAMLPHTRSHSAYTESSAMR